MYMILLDCKESENSVSAETNQKKEEFESQAVEFNLEIANFISERIRESGADCSKERDKRRDRICCWSDGTIQRERMREIASFKRSA